MEWRPVTLEGIVKEAAKEALQSTKMAEVHDDVMVDQTP